MFLIFIPQIMPHKEVDGVFMTSQRQIWNAWIW